MNSGRLSESPCNLCPRLCGARRNDGQRGVCGSARDMLVARAALHFWEEPPLSGDAGSGAVFFVNCPLRCVYCQNAEIAAGGSGVGVDEERLAGVFLDLQGQGALNVNCVTPTHYSIRIAHAVAIARSRGLSVPVLWNTSGYERAAVIESLSSTVDVYLADFKYADEMLASRYSQAPDYPQVAMRALEAMVESVGEPVFDEVGGQPRMVKGVMVRHLVLPQAIEQSKRALSMVYEKFGNSVLYSIMNQYTPVMSDSAIARFPELGERVADEEYERVLDYADSLGIDDYYWQEGPAAQESFIPLWDGSGVTA